MVNYFVKKGSGKSGCAEIAKIEGGKIACYRDIGGSTTSNHRPQWIEVTQYYPQSFAEFIEKGWIETDSKFWDTLQKMRKKSLKLDDLLKTFSIEPKAKEAHFRFTVGSLEPVPKTKVIKFNSTNELADKALNWKREVFMHKNNTYECINSNVLSEEEKNELTILGFKMV